MKYKIFSVLLAIFIAAPILNISEAAVSKERVDIFVGTKKIESESYISKEKRTMVPVSLIASELGFNTTWDEKNQIVTITNDSKILKLQINNSFAYVNNEKTEIDPGKGTKAVIKNGRTMLPIAFVANSFGIKTDWRPYQGGGGAVVIIKPSQDSVIIEKNEEEKIDENKKDDPFPVKKKNIREELYDIENELKNSNTLNEIIKEAAIPYETEINYSDLNEESLYLIVKEAVNNKKTKIDIVLKDFNKSEIENLKEIFINSSKGFDDFGLEKYSAVLKVNQPKGNIFSIELFPLMNAKQEVIVEKWVDLKVKEFSSKNKGINLQMDQLRYITNLLVTTFEYDTSLNNRTEYQGLTSEKFVCSGYAKLSKRFYDEFNIENILVTGDADGPHLWNKVKIGENWYHIDNTFNDPIIEGSYTPNNNTSFEFFMKDDSFMRKTHIW